MSTQSSKTKNSNVDMDQALYDWYFGQLTEEDIQTLDAIVVDLQKQAATSDPLPDSEGHEGLKQRRR
ncbi:hypothetical protein [Parasitella parasitica]|uniref:Uncharacterized protein n=1 Tax=Parasitella parasitica TaxID=35722 RepID=A0A0B7NDG7_9FUNG|nr:hypothetical protein [Parasitella parasitica]